MTCPTSKPFAREKTRTCSASTRVRPCSNTAYRSELFSTSATTKTSFPTIGSWRKRSATPCGTRWATTSAWPKTNCRTEAPHATLPRKRGREKLDFDGKRVSGRRESQRAALVDGAQRRDEIVEPLLRVIAGQQLVGRTQRGTARPAHRRPIERQLGVQVVEEQVTAPGRDLVGVAGGVVVDVIPVPLRPPILLRRIELRRDLWMSLERQHARERFAVGYGAVPTIVDGRLENLDDLCR